MTSPNSLSHSLKTGSISVLKDFVLSLFPGKSWTIKGKVFRRIARPKKIQLKQAGNSYFFNKPTKRDERIRHEKFPSLILNVNSSETGFFLPL